MTALSPGATDARTRLTGIALMIGALACFALLDACGKWLNPRIGPMLAVWVRYAVSVLIVTALLNPLTSPGVWRTAKPGLQWTRSVLLLASTVLNFLALQHLQLAETMAIIFATPLLVALLAGPMLGERIGPRRLAAVFVGFLGVLVVTRPGLGGMHPAALYSVAGVFCYAFYAMLTRRLSAYDSSATTMVYSGLAGLALLTPALPFIWRAPPDALTWAVMAAIGVFGALGHWLLIEAHRKAPTSVLSPFIYTQIIWMIALGWLVFGDAPDVWTLAGSAIVIASGLYLLYRERVRRVAPPHTGE